MTGILLSTFIASLIPLSYGYFLNKFFFKNANINLFEYGIYGFLPIGLIALIVASNFEVVAIHIVSSSPHGSSCLYINMTVSRFIAPLLVNVLISKVTSFPEAASIVAVIVAVPAFSAADTSPIDIAGPSSSSVIVSVPVLSEIVASVALERVIVTVSLF